jgi:hypothetical protein
VALARALGNPGGPSGEPFNSVAPRNLVGAVSGIQDGPRRNADGTVSGVGGVESTVGRVFTFDRNESLRPTPLRPGFLPPGMVSPSPFRGIPYRASGLPTYFVGSEAEDSVSSYGLGLDYFLGIGKANRFFGPNSQQAEDLRDSIAVNGPRRFYYNKFATLLFSPGGVLLDDLTGLDATSLGRTQGFFEGLLDYDTATENFIGSARVDIFGGPSRTITIVVRNTSGLDSLTGRKLAGRDGNLGTERGRRSPPFSTIRQTVVIVERIQ